MGWDIVFGVMKRDLMLGEKNLQLRYDWLIECPLRLRGLDDLIETNQYSLVQVFLQRKSEYCWKKQKRQSNSGIFCMKPSKVGFFVNF